jgi:hypothetical protein
VALSVSNIQYITYQALFPSIALKILLYTIGAVNNKGTGGGAANPAPPPSFWQISWPYSNRWTDYAHHITTCPPPFFHTFLRPWYIDQSCALKIVHLTTYIQYCYIRMGGLFSIWLVLWKTTCIHTKTFFVKKWKRCKAFKISL